MMTTPSRDAGLEVEPLAWPDHDAPAHSSRHHGTGRTPDVVPLHTSLEAHRRRSAVETWARPANGADLAQARLFDDILHSELAELQDQAASAEARWLRRRECGTSEAKPPVALTQLRARIAEAQRLLDALRERFPSE